MKATSPDGHSWSVTRRWLPWRRKVKDMDASPDLPSDLGGADDLFIGLLVLVVLVVLMPFIVLAVLVALELLLLLALLPLYVLARALLGVTWEVEVRHRSGLVWPVVHTEEVSGWSASGRRIADIAASLRDGSMPMSVHARPLEDPSC